MHFHHKHDLEGCTRDHDEWPEWAMTILVTLDRMELQIMSAVQSDLDAATAVIGELVAKVEDLESQLASSNLDSSALNAEVAAAQAALNAPAPAAAAADPSASPVDPAAPGVDPSQLGQASVDPSAPVA